MTTSPEPETAPNFQVDKAGFILAGAKIADALHALIVKLFGSEDQLAVDLEMEALEKDILTKLSKREYEQYFAGVDNTSSYMPPTLEAREAFLTELADNMGEIDGYKLTILDQSSILLIKLEDDEKAPFGSSVTYLEATLSESGDIVPKKHTVHPKSSLQITPEDVSIINQFIKRVLDHFGKQS